MKVFEFIQKSRQYFNKLEKDSLITFIVGNQSADLDSIVSSISLAYFKNSTKTSISYFPILNSTREIVETKDECKHLFESQRINLSDLIFLNEIIQNNELKFAKSKIFLVDHNKLDDNEQALKFHERISGVIDHHLDENLYLESRGNEIRLIDNTIASNALLITEVIKNDTGFTFNEPSLATLLLTAVLIDTNNMSAQRPRITDRDQALFEHLLDKSGFKSPAEANSLYQTFYNLKVNSSNNKPIELILQNDYKQWTSQKQNKTVKYGISSVLLTPKVWIEKETKAKWLNEICKYIQANSLNSFFILASYTDDANVYCRDLFMFSSKSSCQLFLNYPDNLPDLKLHEEFQVNENTFSLWLNTTDANKTRKFWQPRIDEFLLWLIDRDLK